MKEDKILKKISKLLTLYGVDEEEKGKFMADLQDAKYDDQEDDEEVNENEEVEVEEQPDGEQPEGETAVEETDETEVGENVEEQPTPDENPEVAEPEQPAVDPQPEQPETEQPVEQPEPQPDPQVDDQANTIAALEARIKALEDLVSKLGTPVEENPIGVEPTNPSGTAQETTDYDYYNRKRLGR